MKAQCDNCGAQYEIDEARVPKTGLAVKCTNCENLFVVRPPKPAVQTVEPVTPDQLAKPDPKPQPSAEDEPKQTWMLRRPTGKSYPFHELSTLQRWIVERKALKSDDISSDGVEWRKLGEVPELAPFFQIVEKAMTPAPVVADPPASEPAPQPLDTPAPPSEGRPTYQDVQQVLRESSEVKKEEEPADEAIEHTDAPSSVIIDMETEEDEKPETEQAPAVEEDHTEVTPPEPIQETQPAPIPDQEAASEEKAVESEAEKEETIEADDLSIGNDLDVDHEDTQIVATPSEQQAQEPDVLGKTAETEESGPTSWEPPQNATGGEWDAWNDEDEVSYGASGKGKKIAIGAVVVLAIAIIAIFALGPDKLFKTGPPEDAVKRLADIRITLNLNTSNSLAEAEKELSALSEKYPKYEAPIAILSEVFSNRAELTLYDLTDTEKLQKQFDQRFQELSKQHKEAKNDSEKEEFAKQLAAEKTQTDSVNLQVQKLTEKFNEQLRIAHDFATRAMEMNPESLEANRSMADSYRLSMNASKANLHIEKVLALAPEDAVGKFVEGALFADDAALLANALQSLKAAYSKDPSLIKAKFKVVRLFLREGKTDEARSLLKEILAQNPDHLASQKILSKLDTEKKKEEPKEEPKQEKADQQVKKAEPAKAMSFTALVRKAKSLQQRDHAKQALGYYKKAEAINATAEVYSGMGYCYADLGSFQSALASFKKAIGRSSIHQGALFGLGMSYEELGKQSQALKYYKKYLKHYPSGTDAIPAKNSIKRLEAE